MPYIRFIACIFLTSIFLQTNAQTVDTVMAATKVSLITCDPGSDLYSIFGHSAVRVHNAERKYDIVYNYGTFDFKTPGFMVKFMRGKLPYHLTAYPFEYFLREYNDDHRGVKEQVLNITDDEKAKVIAFLENNALPENAQYKYDFFYDNCSSRIRDAFQKTLAYAPNYTSSEKVTMRDLLHQYLTGWPWTRLGIDMIIGSKADIDATPELQMFLPDKMHDILGVFTYNGKPLLEKNYDILVFDEAKAARKIGTFFNPLFVNIVLVLLIVFLYLSNRQRGLHLLFKTWAILSIVASIIVLLLWFATDHQACTLNWNILWLNPLYLLLFIKQIKFGKQVAYGLAVLFGLCIFNHYVPIIPQDMPAHEMSFGFLLLLWYIKSGYGKVTSA